MESSYKNSQNKDMPMFTMGREGAMQIATRYSASIRRKLIMRLDELEENKMYGIEISSIRKKFEKNPLSLTLEEIEFYREKIAKKKGEVKFRFQNGVFVISCKKSRADIKSYSLVVNPRFVTSSYSIDSIRFLAFGKELKEWLDFEDYIYLCKKYDIIPA